MSKTLGMFIAELRKERGMTQLELAEKMGVTDKAVSKWERDLSCPDIRSLPTLAETLGVSIEELMQAKSGKRPAKDKLPKLLPTVFRAVALAMGVAVAVLTMLKELPPENAVLLLGIGLACLALSAMTTSGTTEL